MKSDTLRRFVLNVRVTITECEMIFEELHGIQLLTILFLLAVVGYCYY